MKSCWGISAVADIVIKPIVRYCFCCQFLRDIVIRVSSQRNYYVCLRMDKASLNDMYPGCLFVDGSHTHDNLKTNFKYTIHRYCKQGRQQLG